MGDILLFWRRDHNARRAWSNNERRSARKLAAPLLSVAARAAFLPARFASMCVLVVVGIPVAATRWVGGGALR